MEEKVSVWKANLTNGLILGLLSIVYTLVLYFFDLTFNRSLGYIFMVVQIGILFYMLKAYRETQLHGFMTYGQSLGAGVVIILYSTILTTIFTYILYKFIDTGLTAKLLAFTEENMVKRGMPQAQIDAGMAMSKKMLTPEFMLISGFLGSMFFGTIVSLLVSIFTRKEGNPLVEPPVK
jgi:hypothetical protein